MAVFDIEQTIYRPKHIYVHHKNVFNYLLDYFHMFPLLNVHINFESNQLCIR